MRRILPYIILAALVGACGNSTQSTPSPQEQQGSAQVAEPPEEPGQKEYKLEGEVMSVDKDKKAAIIKHGLIPGFMAPMIMSYPVPEQADLDKIKPGDHITATVFNNEKERKMWVGNIQVQAEAEPATNAPAGEKDR